MEKLVYVCGILGVKVKVVRNLPEFFIWYAVHDGTVYVSTDVTIAHIEEFIDSLFEREKAGEVA